MTLDITIKIGGAAGQGIQTVGTLLSRACLDAGYYIFGINDFESRVRGGHSFFQLRISDRPVRAPHHCTDLLIALDRQTLDLHGESVSPRGAVLVDADTDSDAGRIHTIPFRKIAKDSGNPLYANTAAAASGLAVLGAPFERTTAILRRYFQEMENRVRDENLVAAETGHGRAADIPFTPTPLSFPLEPRGEMMEGARAFAMGAAAADCRVASFYPMSPATGIVNHLAGWTDHLPLVVEQAEDEIAAVNMTIGASFAGARAMTATSGGGFCLMTEGLGLAAMTETPVVIINAQRPGPATGLPTRTAQGDLLFTIHASQDDFPRFVFAPGSPEEAFELTQKAFELAEKYQVPVLILADQYLTDSLFTLTHPLVPPDRVRRFIVRDQDLDDAAGYQRYAVTGSGVSPRALPCRGRALVKASSDEHREDGHLSEETDIRNTMVRKRAAKLPAMRAEMAPPKEVFANASILLAAWGSTAGIVMEAVTGLRDAGVDAGGLLFTDLWPFPAADVENCISGEAQKIITVEQNASAQFARLLRAETGIKPALSVLKYDGRPFTPKEIIDAVQKMEADENDG